MTLRFHQSTFDLLGITPQISDRRIAEIAERERICDRQFPQSIKEWYAIEGIESLFYENTNNDDLIDLNKLGDRSRHPNLKNKDDRLVLKLHVI